MVEGGRVIGRGGLDRGVSGGDDRGAKTAHQSQERRGVEGEGGAAAGEGGDRVREGGERGAREVEAVHGEERGWWGGGMGGERVEAGSDGLGERCFTGTWNPGDGYEEALSGWCLSIFLIMGESVVLRSLLVWGRKERVGVPHVFSTRRSTWASIVAVDT